jgi:hypothetical protein
MKLKFEKGQKIYVSNDGKTFTCAEDCIEHDLDILYGNGRCKCNHEWKYYTRKLSQFSNDCSQLGIQCSKCGKTQKEFSTNINFSKLIEHIQESSSEETTKQEYFKEIYELCKFVDSNYGLFSPVKNNTTPDIAKIRRLNQWIKKIFGIKVF